ncbi:MAG TPA: hypothetical protein VGR78_11170 [Verrucomicrobiae bacterium]|nr:hypothetical protein [Verrucomicrobiae bacterium]
MNAAGIGSVRLHTSFEEDAQSYCNGSLVHAYRTELHDTVGTTNFFGTTNDLTAASASYSFSFLLNTNRTYQLLSHGGMDLGFTADATSTATSVTPNPDCKGAARGTMGPIKSSKSL